MLNKEARLGKGSALYRRTSISTDGMALVNCFELVCIILELMLLPICV